METDPWTTTLLPPPLALCALGCKPMAALRIAARAHPLLGARVQGFASLSTRAVAYAPHLVHSTKGKGPHAATVKAWPCGFASVSASLW